MRQGTPGRAWSACAVALVLGLVLCVGGCAAGGGPAVSAAPSSLSQAFRSAHPNGALPPALQPVAGADRAATVLAEETGAASPLLPTWLPDGYGLAAPYVSVGSGAALPNPQVWAGGYRVSYTDGDGLVVLHVGSGRLPGGGEWRRLNARWRGAALWIRADGGVITVAARDLARPVAVAVQGLTPETALRVLRSVRTQS